MTNLRYGAHCAYNINIHLVLVVAYRRKATTNPFLVLYRRFCIVSWIDSKFGFLNFLEKPTISTF